MLRLCDFLRLIAGSQVIKIYDTVFRLSGEYKLLWCGSSDQIDQVPESLYRCKVKCVLASESYVLKIWVR